MDKQSNQNLNNSKKMKTKTDILISFTQWQILGLVTTNWKKWIGLT